MQADSMHVIASTTPSNGWSLQILTPEESERLLRDEPHCPIEELLADIEQSSRGDEIPNYKVSTSSHVREEFKMALAEAPSVEARRAAGVLSEIIDRLRDNPFDFGQAVHEFDFGMQARLRVSLPIAVQYRADAKNRIAVIQKIVILC